VVGRRSRDEKERGLLSLLRAARSSSCRLSPPREQHKRRCQRNNQDENLVVAFPAEGQRHPISPPSPRLRPCLLVASEEGRAGYCGASSRLKACCRQERLASFGGGAPAPGGPVVSCTPWSGAVDLLSFLLSLSLLSPLSRPPLSSFSPLSLFLKWRVGLACMLPYVLRFFSGAPAEAEHVQN